TVKTAACSGCHTTTDPETIRMTSVADYDGDGDATEGIAGEIETLAQLLYEAIVVKSTAGGAPLVYSASAYPYWFADADANGAVDEGEEGYAAWTPRLLKAAYNYQYVQKDPGAYAHNGTYIMQVLYDSIQDVGGSVTGLVRP
ncbi:MAG: polyheme membrane-associated cytochrome C, partial [Anaerolineaceae bacterium]|nr:polyheme membrane-associated cytochrome C [Anaerolineaceae bacterium]